MKKHIKEFLILGCIGAGCISITEDKYIGYGIGIIVGFVGCLSLPFVKVINVEEEKIDSEKSM